MSFYQDFTGVRHAIFEMTEVVCGYQSRQANWFNKACFVSPGSYAFGSEPRVDPVLRAAGVANLLLGSFFPEILQRDLAFKGHLSDGALISSRLLAWVELSGDSCSPASILTT